MTTHNEKIIVTSNAKNAELSKRNEEFDPIVIHIENLKQEVEYLENKVLCVQSN